MEGAITAHESNATSNQRTRQKHTRERGKSSAENLKDVSKRGDEKDLQTQLDFYRLLASPRSIERMELGEITSPPAAALPRHSSTLVLSSHPSPKTRAPLQPMNCPWVRPCSLCVHLEPPKIDRCSRLPCYLILPI